MMPDRLWNTIISIPTHLPSSASNRRWPWMLWSALCILTSVLYITLYLSIVLSQQYLVYFTSVSLYIFRALIVIALALWTMWGIPIRISTATEQRQGRFIATILLLFMIIVVLTIAQDRGPLPVIAKGAYALSAIAFCSQGYVLVRRGWVRIAGISLLINCLIELLASILIDNSLRRTLIPYIDVASILVAALLVRWWIGLLLAVALPLITGLLQASGLAPDPLQINVLIAGASYQGAIAALAALYARSLESALTLADERAIRLEHESAAREREAVERARVEAYATQAADLATLEERNRIAREIHDGLGHYLMNMIQLLKGSRTVLASHPTMARETVEEAYAVAKEALDEVRRSVGTLRGSPLEQRSLSEVVTTLVEKTSSYGIEATCTILGEPRTLALPIAEILYRVIQEALTNIRKHAQATRAVVEFDYRDPQRVRVRIEDNGKGSDHPHGGFGLIGMHERIHQVDGTMMIQSASSEGFRIQIEVPA